MTADFSCPYLEYANILRSALCQGPGSPWTPLSSTTWECSPPLPPPLPREVNAIWKQNQSPRREKDEMAPSFSPSKQVSSVSKTREAATGWGIRLLHQTSQCNLMHLSKGKGTGWKSKKEKKAVKALLHKLGEESLCLGLASPCSWDQIQAGNLIQADASALGGPWPACPAPNIHRAPGPWSFLITGLSCSCLSELKQQSPRNPMPTKLEALHTDYI